MQHDASTVTLFARGLTRRFGTRVAVQDLDLELWRGEVVGFLGPNGAGKTTTMQMLTGDLAPSAVQVLAINTDESRDVLGHFQVIGIPTVLTLRGGEVVGRLTGAQGEASYRAMFETLANNREVKIPISSFDRMLRLGAGPLLVAVGISTGSWIVAGIGGIIAFLGIYDRCPVWKAITGMLRSQ